ncbi:hypothetical protein [Mucilaginibacter sp. NFX135]|uniref:hypothetical protein n=1 Tax=Mucilaginibacter sp. NFX135 TaxID=3402687 RepID=UPI003AFAEE67
MLATNSPMRFISSKFHAVVDYGSGIFLLCLPKLIGAADGSAVSWLAFAAGIMILLQATLTNYEGGIVPFIPLYVHLIVDIMLGLALVTVSWLTGISGRPLSVFLIMGILAFLFGLFTRLRPPARRKVYNHFK